MFGNSYSILIKSYYIECIRNSERVRLFGTSLMSTDTPTTYYATSVFFLQNLVEYFIA